MTLEAFEFYIKDYLEYCDHNGDVMIRQHVKNMLVCVEPIEDRDFLTLKYSEYL